MLRKILVVAIGFFLAGCGGSEITGKATVTIERSVAGCFDPRLLVDAKSAKLNYEQRKVYLSGVLNLGGINHFAGGWVVDSIEIDSQGDVIISMPSNAPYSVCIDGQYHYLPEIKKAK